MPCEPAERCEKLVGFDQSEREVRIAIEESVRRIRINVRVATSIYALHLGLKLPQDTDRNEFVCIPEEHDGGGCLLY